MINNLLLLSGNDIPFPEARLTIHQPRLKEIAFLGEDVFFHGCELLNFSKNMLSSEDKNRLDNYSDFQILMSIIGDKKTLDVQKSRISALSVITLLFPTYQIHIESDRIILIKDEENFLIDESNFNQFKDIINEILVLKPQDNEFDYNPQGKLAKQLAEKMKKGREKALALKNKKEDSSVSFLARYASILVTGQNKSYETVMNYTIYQLFDEFERSKLKQTFDAQFSARLAGASDIDEMEDWRKELHQS